MTKESEMWAKIALTSPVFGIVEIYYQSLHIYVDSKRDQDMTLRSLVFTVFADPQDIKAYSKALLPAKLVTIRPNSKIPAI
jgi:hypothetical protein